MYALQDEPEAGRRGRVLVGATLVAAISLTGLLNVTAGLERHAPPQKAQRIQMRVVRSPPPPPASAPSPPPPPVEAKPKPRKKRDEPRPRPALPAKRPRPMPRAEPAPEPPPSTPLVVGLTLSSTTRSGKGPRFAVGNTLMGTPDETAQAPTPGSMVRGAPPPPESTDRSLYKNRVSAKLRRRSTPYYPPAAKRDGVEGVVVLSITINTRGEVEKAKVLRGLGSGLDESAINAARSTLWSPSTVDGRPVRSTRRFNVRFTLQG